MVDRILGWENFMKLFLSVAIVAATLITNTAMSEQIRITDDEAKIRVLMEKIREKLKTGMQSKEVNKDEPLSLGSSLNKSDPSKTTQPKVGTYSYYRYIGPLPQNTLDPRLIGVPAAPVHGESIRQSKINLSEQLRQIIKQRFPDLSAKYGVCIDHWLGVNKFLSKNPDKSCVGKGKENDFYNDLAKAIDAKPSHVTPNEARLAPTQADVSAAQ
jgi:hypothetical protein